MVAHGHGSTREYIKLHRNKCAYLIKNIISPALKTDIDDFQNKKYAIITDGSTDNSTRNNLCMLVQFLSDRRKEIVTEFIGLIPVQEATGEKMFNLIEEEIKRCGQSPANYIGFATDGTSNMVVCNSYVSVICWPCAFNVQYPSYHQILDFYCQKYPIGFAIVN